HPGDTPLHAFRLLLEPRHHVRLHADLHLLREDRPVVGNLVRAVYPRGVLQLNLAISLKGYVFLPSAIILMVRRLLVLPSRSMSTPSWGCGEAMHAVPPFLRM